MQSGEEPSPRHPIFETVHEWEQTQPTSNKSRIIVRPEPSLPGMSPPSTTSCRATCVIRAHWTPETTGRPGNPWRYAVSGCPARPWQHSLGYNSSTG